VNTVSYSSANNYTLIQQLIIASLVSAPSKPSSRLGFQHSLDSFHLHAVEWLDLLPSIASFFFRQSKQRCGPPHGAYGEEQ
jgi:hypothetical protein